MKMPRIALWEAVALSLNVEPDQNTATWKTFDSRMSLALGHLAEGRLLHVDANDVRQVAFTRVRLADMAYLAEYCGWTLPAEFPRAEAPPPLAPTVVKAEAPATLDPGLATQNVTLVAAVSASVIHLTKTRRDVLTPVIELAQKQCRNHQDDAEVWGQLQALANNKHPPLIGATEDGVQYLKKGLADFFTRDALRKRLNRQTPISAASRR